MTSIAGESWTQSMFIKMNLLEGVLCILMRALTARM